MIKAQGVGARSKRAALARVGVSWIALLAAGAGGPAWAATQPAPQGQGPAQPASSSLSSAIVITGRRAAIQAATDRKRRSESIIDSVVADEAGKLPDNSITEVLQRVSGVSIVRFSALNDPDHFSVEGTGVQVRGLSGVGSRLNGREIFSANNGRALLWGDVTPELMAAVDVYKTATADLIEGGTGGQIDLRTRLPFDYKPGWQFSGTAELSRGDLAKKNDPSVSAMISNRWDTPAGRIGFLVDLAYSRLSSVSNFIRMEPYFKTNISGTDYFIPGGFDYGEEKFQRKRYGIYGALQWAPADSLQLTGIYFQSHYKNSSTDNGAFVTSQTLAVDPANSRFDSNNGLISTPALFQRDPNTFLPSNAPINSGGNKGVWKGDIKTTDYSLAFQWTPTRIPLAVRGALQRVDSTYVADRFDVFRNVNFPTSIGLDLSGNLPQITLPNSAQATFQDPASYLWIASMPHNENNKGRLDSANVDLEYTFDNSFFRSLKFGGRYADRTERDLNNSFNWSPLGQGWNGDPQMTFANAAAGDVEFHSFNDFFHGNLNVPSPLMWPSYALVSKMDRVQLHTSPPAGFCGAPFSTPLWWNCSAAGPVSQTGYGGGGYRTPGFVLPNDRTTFETKNWAGYGLVRFGSRDGLGFAGNVGVRVVHLDNESEGFFQQGSTTFIRNGQTLTLASLAINRKDGAKFTRVLPAINVQYSPSTEVKLRAAYTRTMDLPSFLALRASGSLGVATIPNPDSTPTNSLPPIFTNFTTDSGNPELKPTMSDNLDFSAEWYPRQGTTAHLALFHKHITNLPIYAGTQQPVTVFFADGTSENTVATATDVANATKPATVNGFEIGGQTFFDWLPGWLKGFGVEGNFTYISSKNPGDLYRDINGVTHSNVPVTGLSKYNFNVALMYEKDPFSLRVAYSWRSKYLQSTNANGTNPTYQFFPGPGPTGVGIPIDLPVYGDTYGTLDAGIRYKLNKHFSVYLQGTNLLNETQRTLMGGYPNGKLYVRSWFQSDRRATVGVNVSF